MIIFIIISKKKKKNVIIINKLNKNKLAKNSYKNIFSKGEV